MALGSNEIRNGIGIVTIDSPPVNALGLNVRKALDENFRALNDDPSVKAIVLHCAGRTFFAGADINELGKGPFRPTLQDVQELIEAIDRPVVAAIHGTALGGGLELALVCSNRIAVPSARVGLPEVHLGVLPGAGGTQRLPRLAGPEAALDMMVSGRHVKAPEALDLGIVDRLATEGRLLEDALAYAAELVAEGESPRRVGNEDGKVAPYRDRPEIFEQFRKKNARLLKGFKAPENIIKCVEAAVALPIDQGLTRERELFLDLVGGIESAAQRYAFFAERATSKIPDVPKDTPIVPIETVGIVGAGTMGGGIAMNFLNAGIPVTLVDMNRETLDRGIGIIRRNYENTSRKGRMTIEQVEHRMALITPGLELDALAEADLVIEAVFEEMSVKKDVFGKLDGIVKQGAILASNTSFLDLDEIASVTSRPEWVVGMHFFSPANVMRLLEVVRGAKTSKTVLATVMKLARTIAKVPVLSGVCHGFIANRIMSARAVQADALVLEGPTPSDIDAVMTDYGFAMGHFAMKDLVGLDVIGRDASERSVTGDLVKLGRLGQKKNGGYFDYDENRRATPSPVAAQVIADFAEAMGIEKRGVTSDEEVRSRLLYPVVNEGAKVLEEGIALRASDIDMAAILGYGWPVYTGGPMFWADTEGLPKIVAQLKQYEALYGEAFRPSALLEKLASEGGSFTRD